MTKSIYDQHASAFRNVSAFVIVGKDTDDKGNPVRVATVTFKHGPRCSCYFHVIGAPMAKGYADGGGYDKASAAAYSAVRKINRDAYPGHLAIIEALTAAIQDQGRHWDQDLRAAGFTVWQAV